jgi:hypothetical protein
MTFATKIRILGANPYVQVSVDQAMLLKKNWRRPMPVVVQVNGQPENPWHVNMMPSGNGNFYLYLHGDVRKASGTKVGETVIISLTFDVNYTSRPDSLPDWFSDKLVTDPIALENWGNLPPSRQKEVVRNLLRLKSPIAQTRNLKQALFVLFGLDGRYMGRSWHNGS